MMSDGVFPVNLLKTSEKMPSECPNHIGKVVRWSSYFCYVQMSGQASAGCSRARAAGSILVLALTYVWIDLSRSTLRRLVGCVPLDV